MKTANRQTMLAILGAILCLSAQRGHKTVARANRIAQLLRQHVLSPAEAAELAGLTSVDTYDEAAFSDTHAAFKASHNAVLVKLLKYCTQTPEDGNVFYFDGPGGGTTTALRNAGVDRSRLYTANWHDTTCDRLRAPPHNLLDEHVVAARAEAALSSPQLQRVPFSALYLDGCGGAAAPLIECIESVFNDARCGINRPRIAIGLTLTNAEPTGRSLADREVDVNRALASACANAGYTMHHVSDMPQLYGVCEATLKREGGTMTSWLMCETLRR